MLGAGVGLRIGEVSRLQCGDVDLERDVLQIRDTKFGKSRLVPFGPRLGARVLAYLELRERNGWPCTGSAPLFSWNGTSPISTNTIRNTFREELLPRLALEVPAGTSGPRVHGLRHSSGSRIIPATDGRCWISRGVARSGVRRWRHNQRVFRKAKTRSLGR